jgi:uncharacterized protein YecE (DUF72 family)
MLKKITFPKLTKKHRPVQANPLLFEEDKNEIDSREKFFSVGCAGWAIPKEHAALFPKNGTHLQRYAQRFPVVEINSSFYRPHRPETYARWAASVPDNFRFAVKVPREITHTRHLGEVTEPLERFLDEVQGLGVKLGPLLIQLPPSLRFNQKTVEAFFAALRKRYQGTAACEPRHRSWFSVEAEQDLRTAQIARVAADPAILPEAAVAGGWPGFVYYRLHGSPQMYYSAYSSEYLHTLARQLATSTQIAPTWCIFDNTALGAAIPNALNILEQQRPRKTE